MEKIKNWFIEHRDVFKHLLLLVISLSLFLGYASCHIRTASAEEVDSSMTEEEWLEHLNDLQPPSILFYIDYDWGTQNYPLVVPSFNGTTNYTSSVILTQYLTQATVDLGNYGFDGLQGHSHVVYSGIGDETPIYTFVFNDIYTRFTDTFEWGYIEVDNPVTNVTYELEIYDYRQYQYRYITLNVTHNSPINHINISPTNVLGSWGNAQDPYVNPFQYWLIIPTHEPVAYIKSMSVSFVGGVGESSGESFDIYYTGNLNMDTRRYLDALQFIGDGDVIEEVDELIVFRTLVRSVDDFMSIEILPNFSFYDILYIALGIPLAIWLLKLWLGG